MYKIKTIAYTATALMVLLTGLIFSQASNSQLERARRLKQNGVMLEAIQEYESYLTKNAADTDARKELVDILLKMNRTDRAIAHIDDLAWRIPNDPDVKEFQNQVKKYRKKEVVKGINYYEERMKDPKVKSHEILEYARYLAANKNMNRSIQMYNRYLSKEPNDNKVRLELAKQYAWTKRYVDCSRQLEKVLSADSNNEEAWMLLGDIHYWQDNKDRAIEAYNRLLKVNPDNREAPKKIRQITSSPGYRERKLKEAVEKNPTGPPLLDLAEYYMEENRLYEADSLVQKRLDANPKDSRAIKLADKIDKTQEKLFEKRIGYYEEQLLINPTDTTALLSLARHYTSQKRFQDAIDKYREYLKQYPEDKKVRLQLAYVYSWAGRTEEAITEFRPLTFNPDYKREASMGLGEALLISEQGLEEAEEIFKSALEENPEDMRAKIGCAEALRRQGNYDEAEAVYEEILEVDPDNKDAEQGLNYIASDIGPLIRHLEKEVENDPQNLKIRKRLANLYYGATRYYEAEDQARYILEYDRKDEDMQEMLEKIKDKKKVFSREQMYKIKRDLQDDPDNWKLRLQYADLLSANNMPDEAIAQYEIVREARPRDEEVNLKLGELYSAYQRWEEALALYTHLAEQNPERLEYRLRLAHVHLWTGNYEAAIDEFKLAIQIDRESVEARLGLANAYRWSGDIYSAYDAYREVLRVDTNNKDARQALGEMSGAFFRGIYLNYYSAKDNEHLKLSEFRLGLSANYSLRLRINFGYGYISMIQTDSLELFEVANKGNFVFGNVDYSFDRLTKMKAEIKYNIFASRNTTDYYFEIEHVFQDVENMEGFTGALFYQAQDAILEIAATKGLQTWTDSLRTDKIGIRGSYDTYERLLFNGLFKYIDISDGNSRLEAWLSGEYRFNEYFAMGLRGDYIKAEEQRDSYWTPENYFTILGFAKLQRKYSRFSYQIFGALGRVIESGALVRQFSFEAGYKLSNSFNLGGGYSAIRTTRIDGEYKYSRWAISLAWSK